MSAKLLLAFCRFPTTGGKYRIPVDERGSEELHVRVANLDTATMHNFADAIERAEEPPSNIRKLLHQAVTEILSDTSRTDVLYPRIGSEVWIVSGGMDDNLPEGCDLVLLLDLSGITATDLSPGVHGA